MIDCGTDSLKRMIIAVKTMKMVPVKIVNNKYKMKFNEHIFNRGESPKTREYGALLSMQSRNLPSLVLWVCALRF